MTYSGLPGVKKKYVEGQMVGRSTNAIMQGLKKYRAVSTAGDQGCITVWKRADGNYGVSFDRLMVSRDEQTYSTKSAIRKWLKEWLPKLLVWP